MLPATLWARQVTPPADSNIVNRIVLRVNDRIATQYEFDQRLDEMLASITSAESLGPVQRSQAVADAPRQVIREIFEDLLLRSRADQMRIQVTPAQVEAYIKAEREDRGLSDDEFRLLLAQNGISYEDFFKLREAGLIHREVTSREVSPRIDVPEDVLRQDYQDSIEAFKVPEKRRLRELVVIESSDLNQEQRYALARGLRTAWVEGADPAKLAQERSDNVRFLELDFLTRDDLTRDLRDIAFNSAKGEISAPVAARGGVHLLQVEEIQEASVLPYEDVRDRLLAQERQKRFEEELDKYLKELEERAYVDDSNLPAELADFRTATGPLVREGGREFLRDREPSEDSLGSGTQPGGAEEQSPGSPER